MSGVSMSFERPKRLSLLDTCLSPCIDLSPFPVATVANYNCGVNRRGGGAVDQPQEGEARALAGRSGWLFLHNASTMGQLSGRLRLSDRQLDEYRRAFQARWSRFRELGIPYVFAPVPMKETACGEFLPDGLAPTEAKLPREQLLELFAGDPDVEIADVTPTFAEAKHSADLYFRTDTHLNGIGAHRLYTWLTMQRQCQELGIAPRPIADFPLKVEEAFSGDLTGKEKVVVVDGRPHVAGWADPAEHNEVAIVFDSDRMTERLLPQDEIPASYQVSATRPTNILEPENGAGLPSAVVVGDSFMLHVIAFLFTHFRRLTCVWTPNPPFSLIERERPDIVIQLMAERFLIRSPLMPDWELPAKRPVAFEPEPPPLSIR